MAAGRYRSSGTLGLEGLLDKWPKEVIAPGSVIGPLTSAAAEHLGLKAGTPVVQAGADAFIGMVGLGVTEPGEMAMITGSSHLHLGVAAQPVHKPGVWGTYADAVYPGKAIIEGGTDIHRIRDCLVQAEFRSKHEL